MPGAWTVAGGERGLRKTRLQRAGDVPMRIGTHRSARKGRGVRKWGVVSGQWSAPEGRASKGQGRMQALLGAVASVEWLVASPEGEGAGGVTAVASDWWSVVSPGEKEPAV